MMMIWNVDFIAFTGTLKEHKQQHQCVLDIVVDLKFMLAHSLS